MRGELPRIINMSDEFNNMTTDKIVDDNINEEIIPWEELLDLTNGTDVNGIPLASGTLAREETFNEKDVKIIQNAMLDEAVFYIRVSGGCLAMYIDFPLKNRNEFEYAKEMCQQWLNDLGNPNFDHQYFTLTVVPLLLQGDVFLIFNNLVLADGYSAANGHRLILAFDNLQTLPIKTENTNFDSMIAEINSELQRQENEILDSIAEAEAIQKEADEYNPFDDEFKDHFSNLDFSEEETNEIATRRARYKEESIYDEEE